MNETAASILNGTVRNEKVKLLERRKSKISLTPIESQPEPKQLIHLKTEPPADISHAPLRCWSDILVLAEEVFWIVFSL